MQTILQLKLSVRDIVPEIWRRVQITDDTTLPQLHRVIQIVMGWEDYHLHQFEIAGTTFAVPDPEDGDFERVVRDERSVRLRDLPPMPGSLFTYNYDFGDDWYVDLRVEGSLAIEPNAFLPILISGERSGPAEDSGGPWGYMEYLEALVDPKHERHEELRAWRGRFNPEAFSLDTINAELRREFTPRAKKRSAKTKTVQ